MMLSKENVPKSNILFCIIYYMLTYGYEKENTCPNKSDSVSLFFFLLFYCHNLQKNCKVFGTFSRTQETSTISIHKIFQTDPFHIFPKCLAVAGPKNLKLYMRIRAFGTEIHQSSQATYPPLLKQQQNVLNV